MSVALHGRPPRWLVSVGGCWTDAMAELRQVRSGGSCLAQRAIGASGSADFGMVQR